MASPQNKKQSSTANGRTKASQGQRKGDYKEKNTRNKIEKMRNLLRPEAELFYKRLPKKLEFGHTYTANYKRHTGSVKSIFWNPNTQAYVSYNEKNLHVWKPETEEQLFHINLFQETLSHSISCIIYSSKYHIYLAISEDFKLHIFNEHLNKISTLPLKVRLINFAYFYEPILPNKNDLDEENKSGRLVTAGIDGCFIFEFNIKCKYDPKQAVLLDPSGHTMSFTLGNKIRLEKMPLWIKGMKVDEKEGCIYLWSQLKTCFNDLQTGANLFKFKSLTQYEDYITDLILSEEYKYFITSTYFGHIFVWKLDKHRKLIHSFNEHTKTVTSMSNHPYQNTLFISASLDCSIRIWCLDLDAGITNVKMMNERVFACFYQSDIKIGQLHHLAISFCNSRSNVAKIGKCFKDQESIEKCEPFAIFTQFKDNSAIIQDPLTGKTISTIYPPPTAKEVSFIAYSITLERMIIMLDSGTLCVYKIDKDTAILEKLQYSNQLKDSEGKSVSQQITAMEIVSTVPIKYDCEIFNEITTSKHIEEFKIKDPNQPFVDHFLLLVNLFLITLKGLSKGTLVFLDLFNLEQVYARFSIHRKSILQIYEIKKDKKLISICEDLLLNIWGFQNNKNVIFQNFNILRPLRDIRVVEDILYIGFQSGDTDIFKWNEQEKCLLKLNCEKMDEHEEDLTSLDILLSKKMLVSGGEDGCVKIRNIKKELIREIRFPEPITSVTFLNENADILVGHVGKVSSILSKDYKPFEIKGLAVQTEEEIQKLKSSGARVTQLTFVLLKKFDDDLKKQFEQFFNGGSPPKPKENLLHKLTMGGAIKEEEKETVRSISKEKQIKKQEAKKKGEDEENYFSEELYQKALKEAEREQEKRNEQRYKLVRKNTNKYDTVQDERTSTIQKQRPNRKKQSQQPKKDYTFAAMDRGSYNSLDNRINPNSSQIIQSSSKVDTSKSSVLDLDQYRTGKVTALPQIMKNQSSNMSILNQMKQKTHMTRREITENRIVQNILLHNDPKDIANYDHLYVSTNLTENYASQASQIIQVYASQPSNASFNHPSKSANSKRKSKFQNLPKLGGTLTRNQQSSIQTGNEGGNKLQQIAQYHSIQPLGKGESSFINTSFDHYGTHGKVDTRVASGMADKFHFDLGGAEQHISGQASNEGPSTHGREGSQTRIQKMVTKNPNFSPFK